MPPEDQNYEQLLKILEQIDTHFIENIERVVESLSEIDRRLQDTNGWLKMILKNED